MASVSFRWLNEGAVRGYVNGQLDQIAVKTANRMGEEMAKEGADLMAADHNLGRPYDRRRYPGSRRAATALDYQVTGSSLPIRVTYRVLGGDNVTMRIVILNWGRTASNIRPSGTWPLTGRSGQSHFKRSSTGAGVPQAVAWPGHVYPSTVSPGSSGTKFLERGRDSTVARNT